MQYKTECAKEQLQELSNDISSALDKHKDVKELFANPDVDGGLIGGAALKVSDFKGIIDAFN